MWQVILYISPVTVALFVATMIALCLIGAWWRTRTDGHRATRTARVLLLAWGLVTLVATVSPTQPPGTGGHDISWIPGEGLWQPSGYHGAGVFDDERDTIVRLQLANAAIFAPLAALLALSFPALSGFAATGSCLAMSGAIEATQFLMAAGRTADVDDLLFNTVGGAIGVFTARSAAYAIRLSARPGRHRA